MVTKVVIESHFYDMPAKDAAKELGVHYSTLLDRVNSSSPQWANWQRVVETEIVINKQKYTDIDKAILALLDLKYKKMKSNKQLGGNVD